MIDWKKKDTNIYSFYNHYDWFEKKPSWRFFNQKRWLKKRKKTRRYISIFLPLRNLFNDFFKKIYRRKKKKNIRILNIGRDIRSRMSWTSLKARNSRPGKSKKKVAAAAGSPTKVPVTYTGWPRISDTSDRVCMQKYLAKNYILSLLHITLSRWIDIKSILKSRNKYK